MKELPGVFYVVIGLVSIAVAIVVLTSKDPYFSQVYKSGALIVLGISNIIYGGKKK